MAINKRIAKPTAMPAMAPFGSGDLLDESGSEGVVSAAGVGRASVEHEDEPSGAVEHSGVGKMNWICLPRTWFFHVYSDSDLVVVAVIEPLPSMHMISTCVLTLSSG